MKKVLVALLVLAMMISVSAFAEEAPMTLELGTSGLSIEILDSYVEGEMTEEDIADYQVGYYKSDLHALDFDVYQWEIENEQSLEDAAKEEAAKFDAEVSAVEFNGIAMCTYESMETLEEIEYHVVNYVIPAGNYYVEISFWLDGEEAEALKDQFMNTIAYAG